MRVIRPPFNEPTLAEAHVDRWSRRWSRRRVLTMGGLGLLGLASAGNAAGLEGEVQTRFFRIATGATSGTYFVIGGLIAGAISNPPGSPPCAKGGSCGVPGLIAITQASSGAIANLADLQAHAAEAAFVQSDTAFWAMTATGPFADHPPLADLRSMGALYTEAVHLVVAATSNIHSPADIAGRTISIGETASGTLVDASLILDAYGLGDSRVTTVRLRLAGAAERLAAGQIDGFFIVGGAAVPAVADLATRMAIRLIPFADAIAEKLLRDFRYFHPLTVTEGTYKDVPETRTLGVGAELITTATQDEALVHDVLAVLWSAGTREILAAKFPRDQSLSPSLAANATAIPLHPGARRFYAEIGALKVTADPQP